MPALIHDSDGKDAFHRMVDALREKLGPSSGISCDDVDPNELQAIMKAYESEESEWSKYVHIQCGTNYTRNLVDNCNGKSNLLILVWAPGKGSPIHDHANAHCIMRILKGRLKETLYNWPTVQLNNKEERPLEIKKETVFEEGEVTYMSDKLGLHEISNTDPYDFAISLHLYTPPNASVYGCHKFVAETGKAIHVKGSVYSEYGQKV